MKTMTTILSAALAATSAFAQEPTTTDPAPASWEVEAKTNPIDDTASEVFARLTGEAYRGNPLGIVARCMADSTDLLILVSGMEFMPFSEYIGGNIQTKVRFDKDAATSAGGNASTDGNAYFLSNPIQLIKQLANAETLAIEVTTNKAQFISTFQVGEFRPIAQQIADACHWDLPAASEGAPQG